ncbi:MAG: hypothetical protein ACXW5U_08135 [Thermoanaerobaculia bacterium]
MPVFRSLLFWLSRPPDTDPERMTYTMWNNFLDLIAGLMVIIILLIVVTAVAGYATHARRMRIVHPNDYFRTYTPLRWPALLALLPAIILFWRYIAEYKRLFPGTLVSPIGGAVSVAAASWLLSWTISRLIVMLPGITPRQFRYRPIARFIPRGDIESTGRGER